jgi:hypothetical protein
MSLPSLSGSRPSPVQRGGALLLTGLLGGLLWSGFLLTGSVPPAASPTDSLQAGFAEADITPTLGKKPVYLAGFGHNRRATGVHDPLKARVVVLRQGTRKLALVSLDLIGFFLPEVETIRRRLPGFTYLLVSSTHNHEGPDTLGLWGPNTLTSGVDRQYIQKVQEAVVQAVRRADTACRPVRAEIGRAQAPELLHDNRLPIVKHDELVALRLREEATGKPAGLLINWHCHPETLGSKNTLISADFVAATVGYLERRQQCPVVYFSGSVGGLMTSLELPVRDAHGRELADGTFEKTWRYGELVGQLAERALAGAQAVRLTPFQVRRCTVYLPLDNRLYLLGWRLGVVEREAFLWSGSKDQAQPLKGPLPAGRRAALRTEIGWLRLGEVDIAAIPGEIYPELVLDKVQDPPDPGADFPQAPIEPAIYKQLPGPYRLLFGLANDEIGYIIPKRQWDERPPYCYKLSRPQYGEVNSVGPETAPLLCAAFRQLVQASPRQGE